jgi:hypothetical protein
MDPAATGPLSLAIRGLASTPVLDEASDPPLPLPSSAPAVPTRHPTNDGLRPLTVFRRHGLYPAAVGNLTPSDWTRKPMELDH